MKLSDCHVILETDAKEWLEIKHLYISQVLYRYSKGIQMEDVYAGPGYLKRS